MQSSTILLIVFSLYAIKGQLINPHSMDTDFKNILPNGFQNARKEKSENRVTISEKECSSDMHFRRIVRIILNNAYLDSDMGNREGYINIRLNAREYQFLTDFSESSKSDEHVFKEISSIFEIALRKPTSEKYHELILSWQERIFNPTFTSLFSVFASALIVLYITYKLLQIQLSWLRTARTQLSWVRTLLVWVRTLLGWVRTLLSWVRTLLSWVRTLLSWVGIQLSWVRVKYFIIWGYVFDFVIIYRNIMREEEIENMVKIKKFGTVPPECDPKKMSWSTYAKTQFKSFFAESPCKEYYQATYQNSYFSTAPSKVLTRQFRTFILEPLDGIGGVLSKFGFAQLQWGLSIVVFPVIIPIVIIVLLIIIFMVFFFIAKPHFKLSFFNWITFEIGQSVRTEAPPVINNEANRRPRTKRQVGYAPSRPRRRRNGNIIAKVTRGVGGTASHRTLREDVSNNESSSREGSSIGNSSKKKS